MSKKYDLLVEKIQNTILDKLNEKAVPAQPAQMQQPQIPAQPAVQQPVAQPTQVAAQEVPAEEPAEGGQQGVDEVDMSEIQELSGQLAQMLRDFKATQEDGGVEACKFAAGMVVAAAIDGLDYKDRKDILKKLKAGEFNSAEEEPTEEPIETAPAEEPQIAETLLSRRNDKEDRDLRMADKKRGNKLRKSSPFTSPVQEATFSVDLDAASANGSPETAIAQQLDDPENTSKSVTAYSPTAQQKNPGSTGKQVKYGREEMSKAVTNAQTDGTTSIIDGNVLPESYIMTKKQLEQVRLHEISFSKGDLEESFKK